MGIYEVFNYTVTKQFYLVLKRNFSSGAVYQHLAQQTDRHSKEVSLYSSVSRVEIRNCGFGVKAIIVHLVFLARRDACASSLDLPPQKKKLKKSGVENSTRLPLGRVIKSYATDMLSSKMKARARCVRMFSATRYLPETS